MCIKRKRKRIAASLIVPLFIQLVYQSILALITATTPPAVGAERDATVTPPRGHKARAGRCKNDEHILCASVWDHARSTQGFGAAVADRQTYREETPDARPHGVVGQLAPAALVHDGALVDAATDEVDQHGDEGDDAEDAARAERLLVCVDDAAGEARAAFEEVGAFVDGGDEGDAALGERVGLAQQRDDGGLAALVLVGRGLLLLVRAAILILVLLVVVVIVVANDLAGEVDGRALRGRRGAQRAAGVVEDELPATEDGLRVLEAAWCELHNHIHAQQDQDKTHPMAYCRSPRS